MVAHRHRLRRLGPCIGLTLAAHAALLAFPVRPATSAQRVAPPSVLQTRFIERTAPLAQATTLEPSVAEAKHADASTPDVTATAQVLPLPIQSDVVTAEAGWSLPIVTDQDDAFFARSALTVAPAPLTPILIEYPPLLAAVPAERYRGELTLFIDEQGTVVRVRAEGDALPAELEEAARRAFMAARFQPGELAEHGAVRSRIRVEVVFEAGAPLLIG